mmetsp:Transcript_13034/g.26467  ORF Transcript_13034/g.26467 Transcript_13034/m.26467 type:complete len:217 (+) Transcript_13034:68-718(+)|eukprot:scaffold1400_cov175-Amphora_coffeaeformis.AAC.16
MTAAKTAKNRSQYDYLFKIVVVGNAAAGKTCLLQQFADNKFDCSQMPTIGVDFKIKTIQVHDKSVKLQLWDTAGQERFRTIGTMYYRGAHGTMIVYDITDAKSFQSVEHWYHELKKHIHLDVPILLVGNKADLAESRQVTTSEGRALAARLDMHFLETSAKTAAGVQEAFWVVASQIKSVMDAERFDRAQRQNLDPTRRSTPILLGETPKRKSGCC